MIESFQHIGMGVSEIEASYDFYKRVLGFSVKLNDHEDDLREMVPIIGELCRMRVIMAMNLSGGAALELVQHTSSAPRPAPDYDWGDIGFLAIGLEAYGLDRLVNLLEGRGAGFVGGVSTTGLDNGGYRRTAWLRDPDGIPLELMEAPGQGTSLRKPRCGGFSHVTIGVSDMEKSLGFYSDILGYDVKLAEGGGDDVPVEITGGVDHRSVLLTRGRKPGGPLPLESGMIRLVESKGKGGGLFEGRRWGDIGVMEMALDVTDIEGTYRRSVDEGAQPFCDPTRIDMGSGSVGSFAYVKDPDGNIIEMVEVEKLGFLPPRAISPLLSAVMKLRRRL
jgi:catechol 2,3-dioxygenase-like lactoylglutathione lyase family enzyme